MKTTDVERHERTRADWLLHHKGSGFALSDQRMSNQLRRRAAQKVRQSSGATESAHHEAQIKPLFVRLIAGGEDQTDKGGRMFGMVLASVPVALAFGPMLAISHGLYLSSTEYVLRQEKAGLQRIPKARSWLIAGVVMLIVAAIATPLLPVRVIQPWPWQVLYEPVNMLFVYLLWQLGFGTLLTAWQVRRNGWPGVVLKGQQDATGLLNVKDDNDFESGAEPAKMPDTTEAVEPEPEKIDLLDEMENEEFEDWMADEADIEEEGNKNNG